MFKEDKIIDEFLNKYMYKTVKTRNIKEINVYRTTLIKAGFISESDAKNRMKQFGINELIVKNIFKKTIEEKYFFYIKLNNEYWVKNTPVGIMNNRFIDINEL